MTDTSTEKHLYQPLSLGTGYHSLRTDDLKTQTLELEKSTREGHTAIPLIQYS